MINKLRVGLAAAVLAGASALTAATAMSGTASDATAPALACDMTGTWFVAFTGVRPLGNGFAQISISNQQVLGSDDSQGDDGDDNGATDEDDPVFNPQVLSPDDVQGDDGDDSGQTDEDDVSKGQGQTSVFQWQTVNTATNLATAQGFGVLFVPTDPLSLKRVAIFGKGVHPVYGKLTLRAQGKVVCSAGPNSKGTAADGNIQVKFADGSTDNGTVTASRGEG